MKSYFVEVVLKAKGLPLKDTYTVPEVIRVLDKSRASVYRMLDSGVLPSVVIKKAGIVKRVVQREVLEKRFSAWDF